jgi:hypothetical protein
MSHSHYAGETGKSTAAACCARSNNLYEVNSDVHRGVIDGADEDVVPFQCVKDPVGLIKMAAVARLKVIGSPADLWEAGDENENAVEAFEIAIGLLTPEILLCVSVNG